MMKRAKRNGLSNAALVFFIIVASFTSFTGVPWLNAIPLAGLAAMAALTRRHYVLRANGVLELDHRQPILFLRSFADDKVRLWGKGIIGKLRRKTIDER
jgi:hypothetical protein